MAVFAIGLIAFTIEGNRIRPSGDLRQRPGVPARRHHRPAVRQFSPCRNGGGPSSTRQQKLRRPMPISSASRAARMPVIVAPDLRSRSCHPAGKTITVSRAAARMASATGRWVVCRVARQETGGQADGPQHVLRAEYQAVDEHEQRHGQRRVGRRPAATGCGPRAVSTHQAVTAAAMRTRPSLDASRAARRTRR